MNRAKRKLIRNIMTMPDDFSEEAIVLQLLLKDPPAPYGTLHYEARSSVSDSLDFKAHY